MSPRYLSTALALATAVTAINTVPTVPEDAQVGVLHFPVTCTLLGLNQTFETAFSATAPVTAGAGQEIYYTDFAGLIDVPANIVNLAGAVNATTATAALNVSLRVTNASPATSQIFQSTLNLALPSSGDAALRIPPGNGTLDPIGPFTLSQAGVVSRIYLGDVSVGLNLYNSSGDQVFQPLDITCGQQDIDYVLGSVNVDNSTGPPFSPANGYVPSFAYTPAIYETGFYRFPYQCTFGPYGNQAIDLIIGGTIKDYFAPGEEFYLSNATSYLQIPQTLIDSALEDYPCATAFVANITDFNILLTNAEPSYLNAAAVPIISTIDITGASDTYIPIPSDGFLTIGPATAGQDGTVVLVSVDDAVASVTLVNADGCNLSTFPVTCSVPQALELIGIPVTTAVPGNYSLGVANPTDPNGAPLNGIRPIYGELFGLNYYG